jgi:hypothetical protein
MNLYTFSKNSWHVKFYQWLFNENPTRIFKTMCPYFWTYVLIFIFIIPILIIKLFGAGGTKLLNYLKNYKTEKRRKSIKHLTEICSRTDLTPEEAYKIRNSNCWKKYGTWDIPNDLYWKIRDLSEIEEDRLYKLKKEEIKEQTKKKEAIKQEITQISTKYKEYKEEKWFTWVSYLVSAIIFAIIFYSLFKVALMINWYSVCNTLYYFLIAVVILGVIIGTLWLLIKYIIRPFFDWLSCVKLPSCGLCKSIKPIITSIFKMFSLLKYLLYPIMWVGISTIKLFSIIGHMIYVTYKKQCPIITWTDDNQ